MTVWTEEVIENTIFELMKDIGIEDDRMPTHKEMVNNRLSGLGAAIVKQGGIQHWAEKLGLRATVVGDKHRKWTDEAVEKEIQSVMNALDLKRMPTIAEGLGLSAKMRIMAKMFITQKNYSTSQTQLRNGIRWPITYIKATRSLNWSSRRYRILN